MMDWITHHAALLGLLFFFIFFVVMAFWVYRPGAKDSYKHDAHIPLNEDE